MAIGKKTGGRDWKPGESGNPNGRPPAEDSLSNLIREELEKVDPDTGLTPKKVIAQLLVKLAQEGDKSAIDRVLDRTEGKPKQSMDVTSNVRLPDVVGLYPIESTKASTSENMATEE